MNVYLFLQQLLTGHFPRDEYVRLGWWMLSMPLMLFILLRAPFYIAKQWVGSKERAIGSVLLFFAAWLGGDVVYYVESAYLRATAQEQRCSVKGPSPYGPYEALVCVTGGSVQDANTEGFVRLRSTETGAVLAERDFYNAEFTLVYWAPDYLSVGLAEGSAEFHLPPTWLDRLRAKLP
jgi:hypothetical protein